MKHIKIHHVGKKQLHCNSKPAPVKIYTEEEIAELQKQYVELEDGYNRALSNPRS